MPVPVAVPGTGPCHPSCGGQHHQGGGAGGGGQGGDVERVAGDRGGGWANG